ncbi:PREDICTED: uncharacterized protein LOC109462351 [Branchiostoma belcheri]|uniref:Uncharacterized protein LOC109462351 n=1 Tax=Branchiostoma belcheri TaxID=7741 RepID=A0A6P4XQR3_BRABE|nr:PREDICTED: uncharacterized protein LOC109462351 [Branchiostoma belcheri]
MCQNTFYQTKLGRTSQRLHFERPKYRQRSRNLRENRTPDLSTHCKVILPTPSHNNGSGQNNQTHVPATPTGPFKVRRADGRESRRVGEPVGGPPDASRDHDQLLQRAQDVFLKTDQEVRIPQVMNFVLQEVKPCLRDMSSFLRDTNFLLDMNPRFQTFNTKFMT